MLAQLTRAVAEHTRRWVLDIGCGAGLQLAAMLEAAQVLRADVRSPEVRTGPLARPFGLALLANVIYYVPIGERGALLRDIAGLLEPGGVLLVVTTVASPQLFSRHFDLLLRAQEGQMELPEVDVLLGQLADAGLGPGRPRPIAPGAPVVTVAAVRPG